MKSGAVIAALATTGLGVAMLFIYTQQFERETYGGRDVHVLIATRDVPLGEVLTKDSLGLRALPEHYVERRHIAAAELNRVVGIRVARALDANESVLWSDLAITSSENRTLASTVMPGMRAITIPATPSSTFGGLLQPGDRVDALLTTRGADKQWVTIPLLQDLLVLATGQNIGSMAEQTGAARPGATTTVTVAAAPQQAQVLTYAINQGSVTIVLRNPEDITIVEGMPETTAADVLVTSRRTQYQRPRRKRASVARDQSDHDIEQIR